VLLPFAPPVTICAHPAHLRITPASGFHFLPGPGHSRVGYLSTRVGRSRPGRTPVQPEFVDVAVHIIQTPGIGQLSSHRIGRFTKVRPQLSPMGMPSGIEHPPPEPLWFCRPGGKHPRQAVTLANVLRLLPVGHTPQRILVPCPFLRPARPAEALECPRQYQPRPRQFASFPVKVSFGKADM
jgi:hypothetical protein